MLKCSLNRKIRSICIHLRFVNTGVLLWIWLVLVWWLSSWVESILTADQVGLRIVSWCVHSFSALERCIWVTCWWTVTFFISGCLVSTLKFNISVFKTKGSLLGAVIFMRVNTKTRWCSWTFLIIKFIQISRSDTRLVKIIFNSLLVFNVVVSYLSQRSSWSLIIVLHTFHIVWILNDR